MSIKPHQLELSVSPITTSSVEEISERCCVIKVYIYMMMMMMMMMMNCFCGMVDQRKAFSLISSWDNCQRSSPCRISDMLRAGFEPVQTLRKVSVIDSWYITVFFRLQFLCNITIYAHYSELFTDSLLHYIMVLD